MGQGAASVSWEFPMLPSLVLLWFVCICCYVGYVCVLYVSLGSNVIPTIYGCVFMGSVLSEQCAG